MFDWLFGGMKKSNVQHVGVRKNIVYGNFQYENYISCPSAPRGSEYVAIATTTNDVEEPVTRCPKCHRRVTLFTAPIESKCPIPGSNAVYRRGALMRIDMGDGHSVRLGKTLKYEITSGE